MKITTTTVGPSIADFVESALEKAIHSLIVDVWLVADSDTLEKRFYMYRQGDTRTYQTDALPPGLRFNRIEALHAGQVVLTITELPITGLPDFRRGSAIPTGMTISVAFSVCDD